MQQQQQQQSVKYVQMAMMIKDVISTIINNDKYMERIICSTYHYMDMMMNEKLLTINNDIKMTEYYYSLSSLLADIDHQPYMNYPNNNNANDRP